MRVFVDEGAALLPILPGVRKPGKLADYAARIGVVIEASFAVPQRDSGSLLTAREREVLELLAEGLSNRAIAARPAASEATIKSHIHHLNGKFGVSTRAEVPVRAREQGLLVSGGSPTASTAKPTDAKARRGA